MNIYDNIDAILREKGISRRELAEKCGLNYNTLTSQFSRKTKRFPRDYAEKIAEYLNVSVEDIYEDMATTVGFTNADIADACSRANRTTAMSAGRR